MSEEKMRYMELILDFEDAVRSEERDGGSLYAGSLQRMVEEARQALLAALSTKQEAGEEDDDGQPTQSIKDGAQQLRDLYQNTTPLKAGEVSRSQTAQAREEAARLAEKFALASYEHTCFVEFNELAKAIRALSLPAPDGSSAAGAAPLTDN